jgi:hypothetical protein
MVPGITGQYRLVPRFSLSSTPIGSDNQKAFPPSGFGLTKLPGWYPEFVGWRKRGSKAYRCWLAPWAAVGVEEGQRRAAARTVRHPSI